MQRDKEVLLNQLLRTAQTLPADKLVEALDFVGYLGDKARHSERGSMRALLEHLGAFHFEAGEMDNLLTDIAQMRALDTEAHA